MVKNKNIDLYKIIVIFFSISVYLLNFFLRDYLYTGSKGDFNIFVFRNIQIFKEDFVFAINNYGKLGDANWPLSYIIHAFLNPFSSDVEMYLISTSIIGFMTFFVLSRCLRNKKFSNTESLALASLILLLPFFSGRAYWGTSANLGWFFFIISIYFFIKIKNIYKNNYKNKTYLIFLICLFSALALYSRLSLSFFCIFFIYEFFSSVNNTKDKAILFFIYFLFAIPGLILISIWGGIYDYKNGTISYIDHNYKNIFKNIPIIASFFFFYLWPIILIEIKEIGLKNFFQNNYKLFILIISVIFFLFFTNYLDYLNTYTYGGGAILKLSYLLGDNYNLIFLFSVILGIYLIFSFVKENFKANIVIIISIFIIYGFPKSLFQDYLEPLIFILFFCGLIKTNKIFLIRKNFNLVLIIYFIFFLSYNVTTFFLNY